MKWDKRFLKLARQVSTWSKDVSTQVGAVLVSPDRRDIILGYNGFPQGMSDDPALYADRPTKYSRVIHAEMNAILMARRSVAGYTLYTWPLLPCQRCAVHMIQAGISRVAAPPASRELELRWGDSLAKTRAYLHEAGVQVIECDLNDELTQLRRQRDELLVALRDLYDLQNGPPLHWQAAMDQTYSLLDRLEVKTS